MDTQFIASRVDVQKNNFKCYNQNKMDCNRFEFFETMVRVANCKYKQPGITQTVAEALEMLIETIKQNQEIGQPSQLFRDELLWTRECNLTLDANLKGIKRLYNSLIKTKQKKVTMGEAMQLMIETVGLNDE